MKTPILITLLLLSTCLFFGCQNKTENFIPGTYVSHTESPDGLADDTLTITEDGENNYQVQRRIGSRAKRGGKWMAKKYKRSRWQGTYDPLRREISDQAYGFMLRFEPDSGLLYLQAAKFQKVK